MLALSDFLGWKTLKKFELDFSASNFFICVKCLLLWNALKIYHSSVSLILPIAHEFSVHSDYFHHHFPSVIMYIYTSHNVVHSARYSTSTTSRFSHLSVWHSKCVCVYVSFMRCGCSHSLHQWQVFSTNASCQMHTEPNIFGVSPPFQPNLRYWNIKCLVSYCHFMNGMSLDGPSIPMCSALLWFSLAFNLSFHDILRPS